MKRTLSILLVIAIIAAFGMLATGCNNNNKTNETTAATVAATQAATTGATTATQAASTVAPTSAPASQSTSSGGSGIEGLSQDDAINKAIQAKPGYYVNSIEKGKDASGKDAWVPAMINDDGNQITVYVSNAGVVDASGSSGSGSNPTQAQSTQSSASGDSEIYAGRSRSAAVNDALASMTFECYVDSVSQGTDNFGRAAWIVIMNGSDGNRYICYLSEEGVITNPYNG